MTRRAAAVAAVALVLVGIAIAIGGVVIVRGGEDRPTVAPRVAMDRACAMRAPRADGPFADGPDRPAEVEALVRTVAGDVRALDLPPESRVGELVDALRGYADAAAIVASADALVDPVPLAQALARARRRLDRVARELRVRSCAPSSLVPERPLDP